MLRASQRLPVQVTLVQGRGLVRAPVGVGPDGPVEVDEQHGLAVDRDGGHVAFPQVVQVDRFPPSRGHCDLHCQPARTLAVLASSIKQSGEKFSAFGSRIVSFNDGSLAATFGLPGEITASSTPMRPTI